MVRWTLQDAKAHFSRLVNDALKGHPQRVTRRGEDAVVVVSASEYDRLTQPEESLIAFFARSPHRDIDIEIDRTRDYARDVAL